MQAAKIEFGVDVFKTPTAEVSRGYSNETYVTVDVDEQAAARKLAEDAGLPNGRSSCSGEKATYTQFALKLPDRSKAKTSKSHSATPSHKQAQSKTHKKKLKLLTTPRSWLNRRRQNSFGQSWKSC